MVGCIAVSERIPVLGSSVRLEARHWHPQLSAGVPSRPASWA